MKFFLPRFKSSLMAVPACAAVLACAGVSAQVITIDSNGNPKGQTGASVDRKYAQIQPTSVTLDGGILDPKTRLELIRLLEAEQGFAMRPFPRGHKGLTLQANGNLEPAGEPYLNMVIADGLCAKPGDRLILTDLKFEKDKIVFMINGGPDAKHRFLRHISIGAGQPTPVVQDDGQTPQGARLTLTFKDHVPELTAAQVKALLAPLISFDVKTPVQAFTDTLPPRLKTAILEHQVLVGMSVEMVLFAVGPPDSKTRETVDQMPFEEWIYGKPPQPVQFIRINGNRVVRMEVAKVGEPPLIYTEDVISAMMRSDGSPVIQQPGVRTVALGDTVPNLDRQAAAAPPTLRRDGDDPSMTPQQDPNNVMKPVQFPKQQADDYPDASKLPRNTPALEPAVETKPAGKPDPAKPATATPDAPAATSPDNKGAGASD